MSNETPESIARRIATVIPPEMVHRGWNVKDLTAEFTEHGQRWTLEAVGPAAVVAERMSYPGGEPQMVVRVEAGSHGMLSADSPDLLVECVRQWVEILGFGPR